MKSVAIDASPTYVANLGTIDRETVTLANTALNECLKFAYQISNDRQIVSPDWTQNKLVRYDIVAKAVPGSTEQLGLKLESRKGPVDVLVVQHAEKTPADN